MGKIETHTVGNDNMIILLRETRLKSIMYDNFKLPVSAIFIDH